MTDWSAWEAAEPDPDFTARTVAAAMALDQERERERLVAAQEKLERLARSIEDDLAGDEVARLNALFRALTEDPRSDLSIHRMRRKQRHPVSTRGEPPTIFEVGLMVDGAQSPPRARARRGAAQRVG